MEFDTDEDQRRTVTGKVQTDAETALTGRSRAMKRTATTKGSDNEATATKTLLKTR